MTKEQLRAKIYAWLYDYYGIKVENKENNENRKKLKKILDEFNPTTVQPQNPPKVEPKKKEYLDTKGPIKVWINF